jgi:hypothetical protein
MLEETQGGGKEENDRMNNIVIYHVCAGTKHNKMH